MPRSGRYLDIRFSTYWRLRCSRYWRRSCTRTYVTTTCSHKFAHDCVGGHAIGVLDTVVPRRATRYSVPVVFNNKCPATATRRVDLNSTVHGVKPILVPTIKHCAPWFTLLQDETNRSVRFVVSKVRSESFHCTLFNLTVSRVQHDLLTTRSHSSSGCSRVTTFHGVSFNDGCRLATFTICILTDLVSSLTSFTQHSASYRRRNETTVSGIHNGEYFCCTTATVSHHSPLILQQTLRIENLTLWANLKVLTVITVEFQYLVYKATLTVSQSLKTIRAITISFQELSFWRPVVRNFLIARSEDDIGFVKQITVFVQRSIFFELRLEIQQVLSHQHLKTIKSQVSIHWLTLHDIFNSGHRQVLHMLQPHLLFLELVWVVGSFDVFLQRTLD